MTPKEATRRIGLLRQAINEVEQCLKTGDPAVLLQAADKFVDAHKLCLSAVMALAYDEAAGVVVGNEAGTFGVRIYEIPYGVGVDGR